MSSSAQPSTDYSGQSVTHEVELPDDDSSVSTELQCDIQPGALRQRYSVQWEQVFNIGFTIISVDMFNLTLSVNSRSPTSGSRYQCYVTIDHDGNGTTVTYEGRLNIVVVMFKGIFLLNILTYCVAFIFSISHAETQQNTIRITGTQISIGVFGFLFVISLCCMIFFLWLFVYQRRSGLNCPVCICYWCVGRKKYSFYHVNPRPNSSDDHINLQSFRPQDLSQQRHFNSTNRRNQRMSDILRLDEEKYRALTTSEHQDTVHTTIHCQEVENPLHSSAGPVVDLERPPQWCTETCKTTNTDVKNALERGTDILLPTSGPPIDPYNTSEYIPKCFTPVATLSQCTHDGRRYYDEHNNFGLEIPAGAISEGASITIDIGVALYGPFQYPEGLRLVSPVFWLCVRDRKDFQFLKPVKLTIPHCLNLKSHDDIESLGLTFLKGDHEMNSQQMYQLQQAEGNVLIEPLKEYGVIETTHFCSRCLSCKETPEFFEKANFCMCSVIPEMFLPGQSLHAYFFIILVLPTCLKTVENQIEELGYKEKQKDEFQIGSGQTLEICLPQSLPAGWLVGMRGKKKVV